MKRSIRILQFTFLFFCFIPMIFLPIFAQAQVDSTVSNIDLNMIDDYHERSLYFFQKGKLNVLSDVHYFRISLKNGNTYSAKLWITASDGGDFIFTLTGDLTNGQIVISTLANLDKELLEFEYTSDATITGVIQIIYINMASPYYPTYTLYVNRAGFAGLWWIILSGIGALAILVILFTFAGIGMRTVAKKKRKKRR